MKLVGEALTKARLKSSRALHRYLLRKLEKSKDKYNYHAIEKYEILLNKFYEKNPEYLI